MARLLVDITPLRVSPAYRRLWLGNTLAYVGTQLTLVAVSLEVFALTGSSFAVGLLGLAALVPLVVAGLYGGAIADRHDRRRVALTSSAVMWLTTVGIAAQAWAGLESVPVLYALVALHSGASGINQPTRGAIIPALVGLPLVPAANALNMMTFSVALMVGPVLGGVLVAAVGYAWTYSIDVVTFLAALYAVWRLPSLPPQRAETATASGTRWGLASVVEGLRFLGSRPNLRMTFLADIVAMTTAFPRALLPAIGAVVLGGGEAAVGVLLAAMAAGAFLAGLFSAPFTRLHAQGWGVYVSILVWGAAVAAFGGVVWWAQSLPDGDPRLTLAFALAALCMAVGGAADSLSGVFRGSILQSATPDHLRGRLQGVFVVVVAGGPRLGELITGGASVGLGEGPTLLAGGVLCMLGVSALMRWQPGFLRYDARNPTP
ncbi:MULTISPECIES: MFS transporter [Micrococcus]|uniref:MFS transporter n=1 Tax=Micrococcus TaxID=1269 RepID=UPI000BA766C1|nr:MFS transporter [Micrococcus luteus]MCV7535660.1 MFS transporter [Micrococcus luteus]MDK7870000.1 MFS transporter [Micrococcus luteus]MDK8527037.1 MFS transporter [Micrococcus luteus]MDK8728821.1 MFS transporter [Micrococcus luteus]PAK75884.1 MFS transporter [Micrococcus luteus]